MRKPWQIWLAFSLCLVAVFAAMLWLSFKTLQLDALRETDRAETEIARQEAELQERISSALYRMDLKLLPLVAGEAARPHFLYQPFFQVTNPTIGYTAQTGAQQDEQIDNLEESETPSPLLFQQPEFVILHFQIAPDNRFTSPQSPEGSKILKLAKLMGISQSLMDSNSDSLQLASQFFDYKSLLDRCLKNSPPPQIAMSGQQADFPLGNNYQVPAAEKISQQIKDNAPRQSAVDLQNMGNKLAMQRSRGQGRVNDEFERRLNSTKELASQKWANGLYGNQIGQSALLAGRGDQMLQSLNPVAASTAIQQGVMQPFWVGDKLVLARRVDGQKQPVIQCCWLNWDEIQTVLKNEVADLLPLVEFQPVKADTDLNVGAALTTIPVQLVVDSPTLLSTLAISTGKINPASGLRMSLLVAWCGFGLAGCASAILLFGVMRLSERRAAFVSAVTHELRTPLTTFRMYAEMLAEKMVPEGKQQVYANTLKIQADRLSHLVENVLQFARLERGAANENSEIVSVSDLFDRFSSRLVERAVEAEMDLSIDIDDSVSKLKFSTQPSTIEQIIFNLVDNACKYAKPSTNNRIEITCRNKSHRLQISVRDYGPGVSTKFKKSMFQPFCKSDQDAANTAPGVGLGLALGRRMAASLGGRLSHEPCKDGAMFVLELAQ